MQQKSYVNFTVALPWAKRGSLKSRTVQCRLTVSLNMPRSLLSFTAGVVSREVPNRLTYATKLTSAHDMAAPSLPRPVRFRRNGNLPLTRWSLHGKEILLHIFATLYLTSTEKFGRYLRGVLGIDS